MQYPPRIDAPNYNAAHYHPPQPPVSASSRCDIEFPFCDTLNCIHRLRRFQMCTCTKMTKLLNLSQPKHTLLLRCVGSFFSTYLSNQIISCGSSNRIIMTMVLTFLRLTFPKLFPVSGPTPPLLRTCHRQQTV